MLKKFSVKLLLFSCSFLSRSAFAAETGLSAEEIMQKMDQQMRGQTNRAVVEMTVTAPDWTRKLLLATWTAGRDHALVKILEPAKERGITSLRLGSNLWNYLPTVERTIKIPPSMMMQPWMGSDFSNDDMVKAYSYVTDYTHTLVKTSPPENQATWVIKCVPKSGTVILWDAVVFTIGSDYLPRQQEFFDEQGRLVRRLEFSDIRNFGGRTFPAVWTMFNLLKKGRFTRLVYRELDFDVEIPESVFSLRNLSRSQP